MAAWLALFAMAMQALWPLAVQAMPRSAEPGSLICTVDGVRAAPAEQAPASGGTHPASKHCPLCTLNADRALDVMVAAPVVLFVPEVDGHAAVPSRLVVAPDRGATPALANPRAPPAAFL